ncbi:MAG: SDR family NAD(P)-dependent oxidoreductase [Thermoflexales bacterium]|nr:SDR family NAD(P)-dependent oxidoreductase [Thermoflexales bacterium]
MKSIPLANTSFAQGEAVLITGCSSGIGRALALYLARHGFIVFATVRKEIDAEDLRRLNEPNLIPICPLDLAKREQIPVVVEMVTRELERRGKRRLYALINNAGGGTVAPVELMDLDKFQIEVQARIVGAAAMVQAFLPLIRQGRGRILWIATPATIPTPYVASIHACDFAINCLARTLDLELKPWGIPSVLIRCGGIKTPAGLRTTADVAAILRTAPADRAALYERRLQAWGKDMAEFDQKRTEADRVAEVVYRVLSTRHPKRRYSIGYMAGAAALLEALPQSWADWILSKRFSASNSASAPSGQRRSTRRR